MATRGFDRTGLRIEREIFAGYRPVVLYVLVFLIGSYMEIHPEVYPTLAWQGLFTIVFLYAGTYCIRNFLHCREAHCVITGIGWTIIGLLSFFSMLGVLTYISWQTYWLAFLIVYIVGMGFEYIYYTSKHSVQVGI